MARKKNNDFKPDRIQSGALNKLFLTQKQRASLLKWVLYTLVLLALSVLQDVVLCRFRLFGATTELVPCGIFMICVLQGAESGSVFALMAGMIYVFSGTGPGIYAVALIPILAVAVTIFRQSYLRKGFSATMLCAAAAMMSYEVVVFLINLLLGLTHLGRAGAFALKGLYSLVAAPVLYPLFTSISKIGGESWKE